MDFTKFFTKFYKIKKEAISVMTSGELKGSKIEKLKMLLNDLITLYNSNKKNKFMKSEYTFVEGLIKGSLLTLDN